MKVVNGVLYDVVDSLELLSTNPKKFWAGIETIGLEAFANCNNLTEITIPDGIKFIDEKAFNNCNSLKTIKLPNTLETIGKYAFRGCKSLTEITIPKSVKTIFDSAFLFCDNLAKVTLFEGVKQIGESAFRSCTSLKEINLPNGLQNIDRLAFENCENLTKVTIPNSVKLIGKRAFGDCTSLTTINIPNGLQNIDTLAFENCENLTEITIPDGIESINESTFSGCTSLKTVKLPNTLETIGKYAFNGCENLENIILPQGLRCIESNAFCGCDGLTEIIIPSSVDNIIHGFKHCKNLTKVTVSSGAGLGVNAFEGCINLSNVIFEGDINGRFLPSHIFEHCQNLTSIKLPKSIDYIDSNAFSYSGLTEISIPGNIFGLGTEVFCGCENLKKVEFQEGVQRIGKYTFLDCENLEEIILPNSISNLESFAFKNCKKLKNLVIPDASLGPDNHILAIDEFCFADSYIEELTIPKNVFLNNGSLFGGRLKKVTIAGDITHFSSRALAVPSSTYGDVRRLVGCVLDGNELKNAYIGENEVVFSTEEDDELKKTHFHRTIQETDVFSEKYIHNFIKIMNLKKQHDFKFVPPNFVIENFPESEIELFYVNNNYQRWGRLVKTLGFDKLTEFEKNNSLSDLLKIYHAIGGFSAVQAESEKALDYIIKYVAVSDKDSHRFDESEIIKVDPVTLKIRDIGSEIHKRFSRFDLDIPYSKSFAEFFMRYYKDNKNFMVNILDKQSEWSSDHDYLPEAYIKFSIIQKLFPNRVVNGNTERELLSPKFVAEHLNVVKYYNIKEGNEVLATIVGEYGYSQEQFEQIQDIYDKAKKIKDQYVIMADKSADENPIKFRVLSKDDPLGFILGDITNCCQHIGGAGSSCVDDGYVNPNAGFLVFEDTIMDENNTEKTRILGQAYVWYDPQTKTVCYDNIEIPTTVLDLLKRNDKDSITSEDFMKAVESSADAIIAAMNKNGIEVDRVTIGKGYNDLNKELAKRYRTENNPKAKHRDYTGYSDATEAQYIIRDISSQEPPQMGM